MANTFNLRAAINNHLEVAKYLADKEADIDAIGGKLLHLKW